MSKPSSPAAAPQGDAAPQVAVGGSSSGQRGATPAHESQAETGGNGGPGLTRNQAGPYVNAPNGKTEAGDGQVASTQDKDQGQPPG